MAVIKSNGVVVSSDATSPFSLQNLTPNTKYKVDVEEDGATGSVEFTTTDIVPNAPTVKLVAKSGAIDFTIVDGSNDGTAITGYKLYYTDGTTPKTQNTVAKTGTITTLTDGKQYTVEATSTNGKGESVKSAKVTATPTTPVTSVAVNPTTLDLPVGEGYNLKTEVLPANSTNKDLTWSTSVDTVASIDQKGRVIGLIEGETNITALNKVSGKSAICVVTVVAAKPPEEVR